MKEVGKNRRVLVLGGTGAMGVYLVPELASLGCTVRVVSLDDVVVERSERLLCQGRCA